MAASLDNNKRLLLSFLVIFVLFMLFIVLFVRSAEAGPMFWFVVAMVVLIMLTVLYYVARRFADTMLRQETEMKQQLTRNISHELKTPVTSILGYTESILDNPDLPTEQKRFFVERTRQQALRLQSLVQDITTLNKIEHSSDLYEMEPCDLAEIIESVLKDVQLQIDAKQAEVVRNFPPRMPIVGNPGLLYSIFRNMTDNSLAYGGEGVRIDINCFNQDANHYYFRFSDNGPGVAYEHLMHLFERFYRTDEGRSRALGGTGLGLSIVKHAISLHGGTISAENMKGGGLGFIFSLCKDEVKAF